MNRVQLLSGVFDTEVREIMKRKWHSHHEATNVITHQKLSATFYYTALGKEVFKNDR